jgi:signal transduction histidine kinase
MRGGTSCSGHMAISLETIIGSHTPADRPLGRSRASLAAVDASQAHAAGMIPAITEMRKTGIDVVGHMPWGTHICLFYETKQDLLDTVVPYCKTGLEDEELCMWVVAEPLTIEAATDALKDAVPDLDRYMADSSMEIISAGDWYLRRGTFDLKRVTAGWHEKLAHASARGYTGVRVTGDTAWLQKKDWKHFCEYEEGLNEAVANQRLAVLCTYPLAACGALEVLDVVRTHQFALARRDGSWEIIETAGLKQAKEEIRRLNEELEGRVVERTGQLMQAAEALHEAETELAHVNRVATMGQLTASIAHEVSQPIAGIAACGHAALLRLSNETPDLEGARRSIERVIKDADRAAKVVGRIRDLIKKAPPRKERFDMDHAIREVIALTRSEAAKNGVAFQTQLAAGLPLIEGDRVQLQQVVLNLIVNAIEAMSGVGERSRELLIGTRKDASSGVVVTVQDSGPGLNPESVDRLFDAFYTTKPGGMGMGLSICRSIIEAHGGQIWASRTSGPGATIQFALPLH